MKFHNSRSIRIETRDGVKIVDVHLRTWQLIKFFNTHCLKHRSMKDVAKDLIVDGAIETIKKRYHAAQLPVDILEEFYDLICLRDKEEWIRMDISELSYEHTNIDRVNTMMIVEFMMEYCHQYIAKKIVIRKLVVEGARLNINIMHKEPKRYIKEIRQFYYLLGTPNQDDFLLTVANIKLGL